MIPKAEADIDQEMRDYLPQVETHTLFLFDKWICEMHEFVLKQIKKRGYLIVSTGNESNH